MDCYIEVDNDNDNNSLLLSEKFVIARKSRKCYECGDIISPGTKYRREVLIGDDGFSTFKTCLPCFEIRETFFNCGFYYGCIWEEIWNQLDYLPICPMGKLSSAALEKLDALLAKSEKSK